MDIENRVKYYMGKYYNSKIYHKDLPLKYIDNGNNFINSKTMIINKKNLYDNFKKYNDEKKIQYHYLKPIIDIIEQLDFNNKFFLYAWGDISHSIGREAVVTKTRPRYNNTMIIQKLVDFRHWNNNNFNEVKKYDKSFNKKINKAIWRGSSTGFPQNKGSRFSLVEKYYNDKLIDVGFSEIVQNKDDYKKYLKNKVSIKEQIKYKFIISVEGNDVASGLKWQLYSNSIVLMSEPKIESWLMEFKLKPYVHYVPIKDDFSNIKEQINWCLNNNQKCLQIISKSKSYMSQFLNIRKENQIKKKIFIKYFENIIFENNKLNELYTNNKHDKKEENNKHDSKQENKNNFNNIKNFNMILEDKKYKKRSKRKFRKKRSYRNPNRL